MIETADPGIGSNDMISAGNGQNVLLGGIDDDTILGGTDDDIIIGDNGEAVFDELGILRQIETTDPLYAGSDLIEAGNGADVVLGGSDHDSIFAGGTDAARDIVLGDNGFAEFTSEGVLTRIVAQAATQGVFLLDGDDWISTGDGPDIVLGGGRDDRILAATGGDSNDLSAVLDLIEDENFDAIDPGDNAADIILGDNGILIFDSVAGSSLLRDIQTSDPAFGGDDQIVSGNGPDMVFGGSGEDLIIAGGDDDADDIVFGDNGHMLFNLTGVLTLMESTNPNIGGADAILAGDGQNILIGGADADTITSGADDDIVFGDNARATFQGTETFDPGEESAILSFNFNASSSSRIITGAAGVEIDGIKADNWNNLKGDGPQTFGNDSGEIVVFDDGSIAPGITIEWGEDLATDPDDLSTDSHSQINPGSDQDNHLFEGYLYTSTNHTIGVDISGLSDHFETFDVYVYLDADNGKSKSGTSLREIMAGGQTLQLNDPDGNTFNGTYVESGDGSIGNYVVFRGLTSSNLVDGKLQIRIDDVPGSASNRPALSGIQIVGESHPIDRIESIDPEYGGNDILITGGGADIAVGGYGNDIIDTFGPSVRGEVDTDIVAGDNAPSDLHAGRPAGNHNHFA